MIKIRNYHNSDYSQVLTLIKEGDLFDSVWDTEENFSGMSDRDPESMIVAEIDGQIVGNIFLVPYGSKVTFLFRLAVKKSHQRQGIATQLLEKAREHLLTRGYTEVGLLVDSGDEELQKYYERRGFKRSKKAYYYMFQEVK